MRDPTDPTDPNADIDLATAAHIALAAQTATTRTAPAGLTRLQPGDFPAIRLHTSGKPNSPSTAHRPTLPPGAPDGACRVCGGVGWYALAVPLGDARFGQLQPCACLEARRAERQAAAAAQQLAALRNELGALAAKTFAAYVPTWPSDPRQRDSLHRARQHAMQYADAPGDRWLFISGPPGTGKSHLAAAAAIQIAQTQQVAGYYRSVPDMLDALRSGYRAGTFDANVLALCTVPVLVLDDLGAEPDTEQNRALLFRMVNFRADRTELLTVITSNAPLADVPDRRIASRLAMRCIEIRIVAGDYRVILGRARTAA